MKSYSDGDVLRVLSEVLRLDQDLTGHSYLRALVCRMAATFEATYVLVARPLATDPGRVETCAACKDGAIIDNFSYDLRQTPCQTVLTGRRVCIYPADVAVTFPEDVVLADWGVASYVGAPVVDAAGALVALLVMLGQAPIHTPTFYEAVGEFLAERIALALQRIALETELRARIDERTKALEATNAELRTALHEIKTLRGIIPICMECGLLRNEAGFWQRVDAYLAEHTGVSFSHGYCASCEAAITQRYFGPSE